LGVFSADGTFVESSPRWLPQFGVYYQLDARERRLIGIFERELKRKRKTAHEPEGRTRSGLLQSTIDDCHLDEKTLWFIAERVGFLSNGDMVADALTTALLRELAAEARTV